MEGEIQVSIAHLPHTELTPTVVLHQALDRRDLKAVILLMQGDDGAFEVDWSRISVADLCMAARVLQTTVDRLVMPSAE